jgi:hypothetical protein
MPRLHKKWQLLLERLSLFVCSAKEAGILIHQERMAKSFLIESKLRSFPFSSPNAHENYS